MINLAHSELIRYVPFMYFFSNMSLKMAQINIANDTGFEFWDIFCVLTPLWLDIRGSLCSKRGNRRLSTDSIHPHLYTIVTGKRQGKCSGKQRRHNQTSVLLEDISNYIKVVLLISLFKKMYVYLKQIVSNICTIKHFLKLQWSFFFQLTLRPTLVFWCLLLTQNAANLWAANVGKQFIK